MDIPEPAVPCHGVIARLEETVNNRIRSVGRVVRRPYSDSEESDNDVCYAEVDDSALGQPTVDLCGEGCAQLDDFKWFLPTDEWAGDLRAYSDQRRAFFFCCGNSAADISEPHTFKWGTSADDVFPSANFTLPPKPRPPTGPI